MDKKRAFKQHWQERYVNKAMERIGLPIKETPIVFCGVMRYSKKLGFDQVTGVICDIDYEKVFYSNGAVDWSTIMQNK